MAPSGAATWKPPVSLNAASAAAPGMRQMKSPVRVDMSTVSGCMLSPHLLVTPAMTRLLDWSAKIQFTRPVPHCSGGAQ